MNAIAASDTMSDSWVRFHEQALDQARCCDNHHKKIKLVSKWRVYGQSGCVGNLYCQSAASVISKILRPRQSNVRSR